jgi:hypothetical protein
VARAVTPRRVSRPLEGGWCEHRALTRLRFPRLLPPRLTQPLGGRGRAAEAILQVLIPEGNDELTRLWLPFETIYLASVRIRSREHGLPEDGGRNNHQSYIYGIRYIISYIYQGAQVSNFDSSTRKFNSSPVVVAPDASRLLLTVQRCTDGGCTGDRASSPALTWLLLQAADYI